MAGSEYTYPVTPLHLYEVSSTACSSFQVSRLMVATRGENRGSFLTGSSIHILTGHSIEANRPLQELWLKTGGGRTFGDLRYMYPNGSEQTSNIKIVMCTPKK